MGFPGKLIATVHDSFYLVSMEEAEFLKNYKPLLMKPFSQMNYLSAVELLLSPEETTKQKKLAERMKHVFHLYLGLFTAEGEYVGGHMGDQKSESEYYMRLSSILPAYQKRGLYTAMLSSIIKFCIDEGFQVISSKHLMTNNQVIIPKLKADFVIVGTELSEKFGNQVRLEYHVNETQRQMINYRAGMVRFNPEWEKLRPVS